MSINPVSCDITQDADSTCRLGKLAAQLQAVNERHHSRACRGHCRQLTLSPHQQPPWLFFGSQPPCCKGGKRPAHKAPTSLASSRMLHMRPVTLCLPPGPDACRHACLDSKHLVISTSASQHFRPHETPDVAALNELHMPDISAAALQASQQVPLAAALLGVHTLTAMPSQSLPGQRHVCLPQLRVVLRTSSTACCGESVRSTWGPTRMR